MPHITHRVAGAAFLGVLLTACSAEDAQAAEDPETAAEQELQKARAALANWSSMKADEFQQAAQRALQATERRIESLRKKVADSNAAAEAREQLAELERERKQLAQQLSELGDKAADQLQAARKAIVDGYGIFSDRLANAWDALTGKQAGGG